MSRRYAKTRVDAVAQELVGDVVEVDARFGEPREHGAGVLVDGLARELKTLRARRQCRTAPIWVLAGDEAAAGTFADAVDVAPGPGR